MANRMIHTPSFLTTANLSEYWQGGGSGIAVTAGYYRRSSGSPNITMQFDNQTGWTLGFRFKIDPAPNAGTYLVASLLQDGAAQVELRWTTSTGVFTLTRNATLIATGTTFISLNVDYYIEWQTFISDTVGVGILKVDGATDTGINSSVLDTRNGTPTTANQVQYLGSNNSPVNLRDIYVNDNAGGVDDAFWGPITVATLTPSAAGNKAQWTPLSSTNVSNVDEATMDGDTTYNSTATNGNIDSFILTDTGYASGTVLGVETAMEVRRTDVSATARIAPLWRIGSTDYPGTDIAPTFSYVVKRQQYRVSPATSTAWTVTELDGAELGYKRTAA